MTDLDLTTPRQSYGRPNPAPNKPTECPRCGAPAISVQGVAKHDLWHRGQDVDEKRKTALLDRLETFLDGVENLTDPETGEPQKFPAWKAEVDEIIAELEDIPARVKAIEEKPAAAPATAEDAEIIPWPGDSAPTDEPAAATDDPADDADEDALAEATPTTAEPGPVTVYGPGGIIQ